MAKFKAGDRVKKVAPPPDGINDVPMGATGVVIGPGVFSGDYYLVDFSPVGLDNANMAAYQLAPLTDPKADAFIEQVKKWKPEPETSRPCVDADALDSERAIERALRELGFCS
jgi:hypothetical protein